MSETAQSIAHELFAHECFAFTGEGPKPHSERCQKAAQRLEQLLEGSLYYVWSAEHAAWWRPGHNGYAKGVNDAGRYTREQAIEICRNAIPTSGHLGYMSEMPVRCTDVIEFLRGQMIPGPLLNGDRR